MLCGARTEGLSNRDNQRGVQRWVSRPIMSVHCQYFVFIELLLRMGHGHLDDPIIVLGIVVTT
jgi:hypothetical protein